MMSRTPHQSFLVRTAIAARRCSRLTLSACLVLIVTVAAGASSAPATEPCDSNSSQEMNYREIFRDGARLSYQIGGHGDTTLVFIHAMPNSSGQWSCQFAEFQDAYKIVAFDLRGYGRSGKIDSVPVTLTGLYADDVAFTLEHLGLSGVVLIGHALGGHVAIDIASRYPGLVDKLVLVSTSPRFSISDDWEYGFTQEELGSFREELKSHPEKTLTGMFHKAVEEVCQEQRDDIENFVDTQAVKAGVATVKAFFDYVALEDLRASLRKITAPTLIVSGQLDTAVPRPVSLYMRDQIPNALLVELPQTGHFIPLTRPVLFNAVLRAFLASDSCEVCRKIPGATASGQREADAAEQH